MIKSINKLVKQNKSVLKEHCTSKYFTKIRTMEDALIEVFSDKDIQKLLKTRCVPAIEVKENQMFGEVKISFILASDETLSNSGIEKFKKSLC